MAPTASYVHAGASDSEDDLMTATETTRTSAAKTTKAKSATAAKTGTKRKAAAPKQSRQALKDRTNQQDGSGGEEVDEEEELEPKPKAKRAKAGTTKKASSSARSSSEQPPSTATKQARGRKVNNMATEPLGVIPETQPDRTEMEDVSVSVEQDVEAAIPPPPPTSYPATYTARARSRSTSLQPLLARPSVRSSSLQPGYPAPRERSVSVNGTDRERRGGDPELRRKFHDLTRKYEDLTLKYETLQDIAKSESETNFQRLKKASDQKAKDASELIISLKKEIAELKKASKSSASETNGLQKQVSEMKLDLERLTAEKTEVREKMQASQRDTKILEEKAQTAENERNSLEAKLVAARQQLSTQETSKMPGSAIKTTGRNAAVVATTDAQKEAKMKENLYSDLTGLIIRGVKRRDGEDEYDCIQTGRNGTLHFHLVVANDTAPKTPSAPSYEEEDLAYEPLLDESRDRELINILPDFLVEEISFPRNQAMRFYTTLIESMTKKIVVEDDD